MLTIPHDDHIKIPATALSSAAYQKNLYLAYKSISYHSIVQFIA